MSKLPPRQNKFRVGVLGATGLVGQLFVEYLLEHPWFELAEVTGSTRTIGKSYGDAVDWLCESDLPSSASNLTIRESLPNDDLDLVLSALQTEVAMEVEPMFAQAGIPVVSNAAAFRMAAGVPLLIPEVNANHLNALRTTEAGGFIVASPNCSTIGLASALAPLESQFGLAHVHVTTLQALSGAGLPGVAGIHSTANVIPEISGEEEKLETEPLRIFGSLKGDTIVAGNFRVSAQCNRVPVVDGHLCSVSVKLRSKPPLELVRDALQTFETDIATTSLPSKPDCFLRLYQAANHPQPRLHVNRDQGMSVGIGRLRPCPINDFRFTCLVHNTKRGAAGNAVLIAELVASRGLLRSRPQHSRLSYRFAKTL